MQAGSVNIYGGTFENVTYNIMKEPPRTKAPTFEALSGKELPECAEGTRKHVLSKICRWTGIESILESDSEDPSNNLSSRIYSQAQPCILWINGPAGTGKTTLATTMAKKCHTQKVLGASFFSKFNVEGRDDSTSILPTLARQLGKINPQYGKELDRILQANDDIHQYNPEYQIEELFVKPFREARHAINPEPCVIIVDALDECQDMIITAKVFGGIAEKIRDLYPIRFIFTSRRDEDLLDVIEQHSQVIVSIDLKDEAHEADIVHFLRQSLRRPRISWRATDEEIAQLAKAANGLFVHAATCVKFIMDSNDRNYRRRLQELLELLARPGSHVGGELDILYNQILSRLPDPESSPNRLTTTLGAVVLLRNPLSLESMDNLLGYEIGDTYAELSRLYSVMLIPSPGSEDQDDVVRLYHESFGEFILDSKRFTDDNRVFAIDAQTQHQFLAERCLRMLENGLVEAFKQAVKPLDPTRPFSSSQKADYTTNIPPHVRYAAQFWGFHLAASASKVSLPSLEILLELLDSVHVLAWIEACASMGALKMALHSIISAFRALDGQTKNPFWNTSTQDMLCKCCDLLRRTEKWINRFYTTIDETPSQVYHLIFPPRLLEKSHFDSSWLQEVPLSVKEDFADPLEREMRSKSAVRSLVTFTNSEGHELILAASMKGIEVWDALSGERVSILNGHGGMIWSVAVSTDGKFAASGSADKTIRIWDLAGRACVKTLTGHENVVRAVVWSPDGRKIGSGGLDGTVRVWDVGTGGQIFQQKHEDSVKAVSFSTDGLKLLSCSDDKTLRVWDISAGATIRSVEVWRYNLTHKPTVAAFSPSEKGTIACLMSNGCVLWWSEGHWDVEPFYLQNDELEGCILPALAFSADGSRFSFLAEHETTHLIVQSTHRYENLMTSIVTREKGVRTIAFLNDSKRIVTAGSGSKAISIWRVWRTTQQTPGGDGRITIAAFSPNGELLVTGSDKGLVGVWDMKGFKALKEFHFRWGVKEAVFSPNGWQLAIGVGTALGEREWVGELKVVKLGLKAAPDCFYESFPVDHIVFSPDGKRIAHNIEGAEVLVWEVEGKRRLAELKGLHSDPYIEALLFSADGKKILTVAGDSKVGLWDAFTSRLIGSFNFFRHVPHGISFTSDEQGVVAVTPARAVGLFDGEQLKMIELIAGGAVKSQTDQSHPRREDFSSFLREMEILVEDQQIGDKSEINNTTHKIFNAQTIARFLGNARRHEGSEPELVAVGHWLWCLKRKRRIMPIPESLKVEKIVQRGYIVVIGSIAGRFYVLDTSRLVAELDRIDGAL